MPEWTLPLLIALFFAWPWLVEGALELWDRRR